MQDQDTLIASSHHVMNYSNTAILKSWKYIRKKKYDEKYNQIMSKLLRKIGQKKELLERKIGGKKAK